MSQTLTQKTQTARPGPALPICSSPAPARSGRPLINRCGWRGVRNSSIAFPTTYPALGVPYHRAVHLWEQSYFPPLYPRLYLNSRYLSGHLPMVTQERLPFDYRKHSIRASPAGRPKSCPSLKQQADLSSLPHSPESPSTFL